MIWNRDVRLKSDGPCGPHVIELVADAGKLAAFSRATTVQQKRLSTISSRLFLLDRPPDRHSNSYICGSAIFLHSHLTLSRDIPFQIPSLPSLRYHCFWLLTQTQLDWFNHGWPWNYVCCSFLYDGNSKLGKLRNQYLTLTQILLGLLLPLPMTNL